MGRCSWSAEAPGNRAQGQIDPTDLDEYLGCGGFEGLRRVLEEFSAEQIVAEVEASGLRGRGGAGFPTGLKWAKVREAKGAQVCHLQWRRRRSGVAFMDRMPLESFPFRIIEGMAIAARAVGAEEGFFYIRAEYPLAVSAFASASGVRGSRGFLAAAA